MSLQAPIKDLPLDQIDISLSGLRISRPAEVDQMCHSMDDHGQLQPVVVRRLDTFYQLLDGFKRYQGAEKLGWRCLRCIVLDVTLSHGVAMILKYNRGGKGLSDYDQALIIYSLCYDHGLDQVSISQLTGYSRSWVCRRLSLVERLNEQVQDALRMGLIGNTQARHLVKLPCGNQQAIMEIIIGYGFSCRDTALLIDKYLSSKSQKEQVYVLSHPREVIQREHTGKDIYDTRLGKEGNGLLKAIALLMLQQNIFIGQMNSGSLSETERQILAPRLRPLHQKAQQVLSVINKNPLL